MAVNPTYTSDNTGITPLPLTGGGGAGVRGGGIGGGAGGLAQYNTAYIDPPYTVHERQLRRMVCDRLHIQEGDLIPFDCLFVHQTNNVVFVFVVANGKAVVFEDAWDMYPSDTLITKLRLISK